MAEVVAARQYDRIDEKDTLSRRVNARSFGPPS
jgi:hypothetical protein